MKIEFQKKVSEAYSKFQEMAIDDDHWVTIAADNKSIEDIHQEILERVVTYIDVDMEKSDLS